MGERKLLFLMRPEQLEAFLCLQRAAEAGDGDAACRLGEMYREGLGGLRVSPKETYRWYARSAMAGDPNGQNNLGACYEHALGCAQSYPNAVKWYRRAAAQALGTAAMNLGYCYLRGHGVPRDSLEALRLFRLAVEGGEERAAQEVERLEMSRGPRGLQLAPEDTAQVRPCSLASGVLPPDGPREQLQPSVTQSADIVTNARPVINYVTDTAGKHLGVVGPVKHGRVPRGFIDRTLEGVGFGIVGGVQSRCPPSGDSPADRHAAGRVALRRAPRQGVGAGTPRSIDSAASRDVLAACPRGNAAGGGRELASEAAGSDHGTEEKT
jgi:hypothetical protein